MRNVIRGVRQQGRRPAYTRAGDEPATVTGPTRGGGEAATNPCIARLQAFARSLHMAFSLCLRVRQCEALSRWRASPLTL